MIKSAGSLVISYLKGISYMSGYFFYLSRKTLKFLFSRKQDKKVLIMQLLFTGVEALPILSLISLGIGGVIIVQGVAILPQFGQGEMVYDILVLIIVRELGPVLTALILAARSGTAITTELGNMIVSHEVEAYESVGINPVYYLAVPRLLGVVGSMILLNVYFDIFGLFGSFLVTSMMNPIPIKEYLENLLQVLTAWDLFISFLKSFVFGYIIAVVSTYHGFRVNHAITEVPVATIKSIGNCFTFIIVADAIITVISRL
ncbi:ABC transporter permease [Spirochaeta isovalerica]|uniref:Phospholipid/cholesterol/gamma-HCH transport system permease protein n=1 Tax=Spirochaeta isovalerica TaxID=150 RepID=A0A841R820_9SPIO|nr:ABC transporter permease [Spirochaeta isovalerica]MBB6478622.1 phospholipid/cholesterol/gamma-HCH transport system permease protein [Spirochaeta isovalerica]